MSCRVSATDHRSTSLLGLNAGQGALFNPQLHVCVHLDEYGGLINLRDTAVDSADGDDFVSLPHGRYHGFSLILFLFLRPDDEKVEDQKDEYQGQEHRDRVRIAT